MNRYLPIILTLILLRGLLATASSEVNFTTDWEQDTITVTSGDSILILTHKLVLRNTETIISNGSLIRDYQIQPVLGIITLMSPPQFNSEYIVNYEYINPPFPTKFGPPLAFLPKLENRSKEDLQTIKNTEYLESFEGDIPVVADGSIFRGMTFSPSGDLSLTGGLRLSLQGRLSDNLTVSGTLTDQNSPIQPEGNTQTLEEIDKVYLEVKHPSARIVAGDIDMNLNHGQFLALTRRLEGLHVELFNNKTNASGYIGSTKGKFHKSEFNGEDQNQGPYSLSSEIGSRNIIIMAGSERVWVDGIRVERGENNDYTIDYSSAEITFTPNRVIESNSRIYVEFEYSDLVYPRNIASAVIRRNFLEGRLTSSLGWVQEEDNIQSQMAFGIIDEEKEVLKNAGDNRESMKVLSAVEDSLSNYIWVDSTQGKIFVYIPDEEKVGGATYYQVYFYKMGPSGEYTRNITPEGKIYFKFIGQDQRDGRSDLYVPWKTIKSPEKHQVLNFSTEANLFDSTRISVQLTGSLLDRNLYSKIDDKDNQSFAGILDIRHNQELPFQLGSINFHAMTRRTGEKFSTFQRDRRVEFSREWNLLEMDSGDDSEQTITKFNVGHRLSENITSNYNIGNYKDGLQNASRWESSFGLSTRWIPSLTANVTTSIRQLADSSVLEFFPNKSAVTDSNKSKWSRRKFDATLLPGRIHLFAHYLGEEKSSDFRFYETGGGILLDGMTVKTRVGLTRRLDYLMGSLAEKWDKTSDGWLGEAEFSGRWRSGFSVKTTMKKKIKSYFNGQDDIDYYLARGSVGYLQRGGLVRTNFDFKLEETLFEQKIVIYDSVGSGLGNYRYDPEYDQYFNDINGDYLAVFLPSGKKSPTSRLSTGWRAFFNFRNSNMPFIRYSTWKIYGSTDFDGSDLNRYSVLVPEFFTEGINLSRISLRNELIYTPRIVNRRVRISTNSRREVSRQTVGESYQKDAAEYEIEAENPIFNNIIFITTASTKFHKVKSSVELRKRTVNGWKFSPGIRWQSSRNLEIGGDLHTGKDKGYHSLNPFFSTIRGISLHSLWFVTKKGRIESTMDYFYVTTGRNTIISLPPEAADGMQIGSTIQMRISGIVTLADDISITANFSFLDDPLHDNFINFSGEVRAAF